MMLQADELSFHYGTRSVLRDVHLRLEPGVTALIGPNAAGKSTLLKCLAGILIPGGRVTLNGRPLRHYSRRELSHHISYLPQSPFHQGQLTVLEAVLLGRIHDLGWRISQADLDRVRRLLDEMALSPLADRMIIELSGGQAQLVAIAQALVRDPAVLLLDEPTTNLDLRRQFEVCSRICELTQARRLHTLLSLHDLNLTARYADRVIVLCEGSIYDAGPPAKVFTTRMMSEVYQVEADIEDGLDGIPSITVRGPCTSASASAH